MKWICPNRYGVPSGMRVEYLRIWLMEDKEKEPPPHPFEVYNLVP